MKTEATGLEIAVIGMSCHFPGAPSLEAFLGNLRQGVESIRAFREEELLSAGVSPEWLRNPAYVKAGGVLDDIEGFDAGYFGYAPREAELIDPQQRMFLERSAEALERAGHDPQRFPGSIGVYAGLSASGYSALLSARPQLRGLVDGFQILLANDRDFLATRVAYKLNLQGPAVVVQTACSTSLAAVHVACQALLAGDCDMALAGGVSVRVPHRTGYLYQEEGIASPDGHCRSFDERANGTVPGSGVGVVVLRRLADARAAGDAIEGVILGSAINNDGAERLGYTAPRAEGQAQVIRAALTMAGAAPPSVGYVEAHGTATALGDPIEIAALNQVFGAGAGRRCAIGSVKSNFGHLDAAAGVAGLIKAVLSLKHRQVFPSLHFERPNPRIDFAGGPFYVNTAIADWPAEGSPRRAGVSSFGMGGTNVHVVLEEAPESRPAAAMRGPQLLVLSARTHTALARAQAGLGAHLRAHPELELADVAFTLAAGRRELGHRAALAADDRLDAARTLEDDDPGRVRRGLAGDARPPVAFMFTGQGAQQVGMAEGLYAAEPVFRREMDECCERLRVPLRVDLREVLYPPSDRRAAAEEALRNTALAQPALFVVEYALARLWMGWGLAPQAMIGHSIGEYVAACLAGVFGLEDALALVAERGRLMALCPPGAMLAVAQPAERLLPLLGEGVGLAAVNAPEQCVIAGPAEAIEGWQRRLEEEGIACARLSTSHAFHSPAMDPIVAPFRERVGRLALRAPSLPFVSSLTGTWITAAQATDPGHWARQLRAPVQFAKGVAELLGEPRRVLLEVGPGDTLAALARRQLAAGSEALVLASLPGRASAENAARALLDAAAQLWVAGAGVNATGRFEGSSRRRVTLPTYPFEHRRYWVDPPARAEGPARAAGSVRRPDVADWFYVPSWRRASPRARAPEGTGPHCLLVDRGGLGLALAERLTIAGATVVSVEAGASFARRGASGYVLDPGSPDDYGRLLDELAREGLTPRRVVHLWGADQDGFLAEDAEGSARGLDLGFFSVLHLAQALGTRELADVRLDLVTRGAQEVTGGERLRPLKAAMVAASRVIRMEHPSLGCRSIDLDFTDGHAPGTGIGEGLARLEAELSADAREPVVALRGRHRWIPAFEPIRLPASGDRPGRLRARGTYLITGGLGGIGLALAEHLARTHQARLVLVSRSGPEAQADRAGAIERIERAGGEVMVARADVADRGQMARVVLEAEQRFGAIHGVVHAAGVPGGGLIPLKTREQAAAVLAPKIAGTLVLHELFRDRSLDFMLLCASLTGALGAVGQVDYAAANAFLDGFAEDAARSGRGPLTLSVAWDTWKETGMAVSTELPPALEERRAELLSQGLTNREGADVFVRALEAGLPRLLVSTRALEERLRERPRANPPSAPAAGTEAAPARHPRPALRNEYVEPRTDLERALAHAWQQVLGVERVGASDNFFEIGGESLAALRLVGLLKESRGLALSLVRLYEAPTVELLARHLEGAADGQSALVASGQRGEARAEMMAQRRQARPGRRGPAGGELQ